LEEIIMLNKRIMSLSLAALTAASLAAPAFAADNTTVVSGAYKEIAIAVTVPAEGTAQINPYGLPVELTKSSSSTKAAKVTGQQIVTQPLYISNQGDVALDVSASVTTTATGFDIVSDAISETETDKKANVSLQMVQSANKSLADDTAKDKIIDECAADATWKADGVQSLQLPAGGDDAVTGKLATLAASKVGTDGTVTYNVGSIVLYRLAGTVTTAPETAWATTDTFTANIAFTFTPHVEAAVAES
jgi:hypothetical protein